MKIFILLSFLMISISQESFSQTIKFELTNPQPELQGSDTGDMEFADVDNDGDLDLIITGSGTLTSGEAHSARSTVYINDGNGILNSDGNRGIHDIRNSKIGLADIDNDLDLDLLLSGSTHGGSDITILYTNDGNGNFAEVLNTPFQDIANGYFNFGDLDNDGDQDILFSELNADPNDIYSLINDGTGTFTKMTNIGINDIQGVLELFDYDNDGDLDVLVTGEDSDENVLTMLYNNDGTGLFLEVQNTAFNNFNFGDIAVGDTDDDGDLDVVIIGSTSTSLAKTEYYTNNGDGTFTWVTNAPFKDLAVSGETSFNDFDNDGDLDLFIIGSGEGGLINDAIVSHIYENLGNNTFILSEELIGGYLSTHAVADVNNDNLLDLVLGGTTTGEPVRGSFFYLNRTDEVLGSNSFSILLNAEVHPNPSNGTFQVNIEAIDKAQLDIYDPSGKRVFSDLLYDGSNTIKSNLPIGQYVLTINTPSAYYRKSLFIQK